LIFRSGAHLAFPRILVDMAAAAVEAAVEAAETRVLAPLEAALVAWTAPQAAKFPDFWFRSAHDAWDCAPCVGRIG
jgi:hypothetical protein